MGEKTGFLNSIVATNHHREHAERIAGEVDLLRRGIEGLTAELDRRTRRTLDPVLHPRRHPLALVAGGLIGLVVVAGATVFALRKAAAFLRRAT